MWTETVKWLFDRPRFMFVINGTILIWLVLAMSSAEGVNLAFASFAFGVLISGMMYNALIWQAAKIMERQRHLIDTLLHALREHDHE